MKSPYVGLWLLLSFALSAVLLFSFSDLDLGVGEWKMKKAPFADNLLVSPDAVPALTGEALTDSLMKEAAKVSVPTDSTQQSILLIGDSMTLNLAIRLSKYAKQNGHSFHAVNWDSSNTKIWAESDTLEHYMKQHDVTFVFVSLGSNEIYLTHPESHKKYVEKIIEKIGDRPYVWIGPPNWKEDSGLNDMIQATCKAGAYFRSAGMEFKRKKDGVHPTRESSALWIDSVARWMPKSAHPILMDAPSDSLGKVPSNVVFLKPKNK